MKVRTLIMGKMKLRTLILAPSNVWKSLLFMNTIENIFFNFDILFNRVHWIWSIFICYVQLSCSDCSFIGRTKQALKYHKTRFHPEIRNYVNISKRRKFNFISLCRAPASVFFFKWLPSLLLCNSFGRREIFLHRNFTTFY